MTATQEEITPTIPLSKPLQVASLYVGDLDPVINEPHLVELFKPFGTILNVRVCRDIITQRSLGYGYVNFDNHDSAAKAMEALNFKRVGDKCVRIMWQQRDPALRYSGNGNIFVKNLKSEIDSRELSLLFKKFGDILSCKVMEDEGGKSRGYGFVHFKEDQAAKEAIDKMNGEKDHADETKDMGLCVANFIRRNARLATLVANFTNVYIKQVLPTVDKEVIERFFSKFGGITSSATCKDKNGRVFAFCNFEKHEDAVKAIEASHEQFVDGVTPPGETLYVQRAQPRSERLIALRQRYMQCQSLGNNLYVRNFDPEFTEENLHELFKEYGVIRSCRVMTDANGNSRGFGFVSFENADQANAALREMNGRMLNGKPLIVNIAQRRDQRFMMLRLQFQQRLQMMMQRIHSMPFGSQGQPPKRRNPRSAQRGAVGGGRHHPPPPAHAAAAAAAAAAAYAAGHVQYPIHGLCTAAHAASIPWCRPRHTAAAAHHC
ncbi:putative polyadenylate-binding protein 1 [Trypanosoma rangeli]|uniref:Putative polyadenylate-binding protein 1 n=1 Tax=Trypanosoma rangeli TaxID=5698 RepID=A0A3R7NAH9_TRYRA|nr:putative polyadenylate-binding protein 1 [Trypanosoma rangeli]RNF03242.1 putative polyadenylate-binding protein 1 [Trypanosoma rangeli]|eukprot:RNF03242.1 putative polyadenylate-binding protein 1 [Trypanosoma rangeli]